MTIVPDERYSIQICRFLADGQFLEVVLVSDYEFYIQKCSAPAHGLNTLFYMKSALQMPIEYCARLSLPRLEFSRLPLSSRLRRMFLHIPVQFSNTLRELTLFIFMVAGKCGCRAS
ncbi:predicted protein [Botrytis cinerea T4]|uniref:Uncharacterized protein n=1 Tax=Botryotinia fuckeliana (strain T4) TaxID=999810 RepID=G2XS96_BOTF4|nr:predicted protein [Botrytis cinerea T4]